MASSSWHLVRSSRTSSASSSRVVWCTSDPPADPAADPPVDAPAAFRSAPAATAARCLVFACTLNLNASMHHGCSHVYLSPPSTSYAHPAQWYVFRAQMPLVPHRSHLHGSGYLLRQSQHPLVLLCSTADAAIAVATDGRGPRSHLGFRAEKSSSQPYSSLPRFALVAQHDGNRFVRWLQIIKVI